MLDIELFTELTIDRWEDDLDLIRNAFPERPIIASIAGGGDPYDWQEVVRRLEPHGVNAYELNVSCPNFSEGKGTKLGQDPEALRTVLTGRGDHCRRADRLLGLAGYICRPPAADRGHMRDPIVTARTG